jgi:P63C domain
MGEEFGSSEAGKKGGKARAKSLSKEQRHEIARQAALARWSDKSIPVATHGSPDKPLKIGNVEIECYVLADGTRVLSQGGFQAAMGKHRKANVRREEGEEQLPAILQGKSINPFIDEELIEKSKPIKFHTPNGILVNGYRAEILPNVCEVYLKARDAGVLNRQLHHVARQAEILIRGLANVGIIALVDEATGYQEVRDRLALQEILDKFLRKEFATWAKRFPDEFYKEIFRLRQWPWRGMKVNRPQIVAYYTKDLTYARLAPRILKELEDRNPKDEKGHRKAKHHQFLTDDYGHPALAQLLFAIMGFMRVSETWDEFMALVNKAYPRREDTLQLDLFRNDDFYIVTQGAVVAGK